MRSNFLVTNIEREREKCSNNCDEGSSICMDSTMILHMLHVSGKQSFEFFMYCETNLLDRIRSSILFGNSV